MGGGGGEGGPLCLTAWDRQVVYIAERGAGIVRLCYKPHCQKLNLTYLFTNF